MFIDEEDDAIVVELYGQQFYWAARVSGEDNVLGRLMLGISKELILGVDMIRMHRMILLLKLHIPKVRKTL
jgi:cytochrome c oxidase subunit 2